MIEGRTFHWLLAPAFGDVEACAPAGKLAAIVFDAGEPAEATLYSNAAAADLVPALRALLARLEAGELRMPVLDGTRWVEGEEAGASADPA